MGKIAEWLDTHILEQVSHATRRKAGRASVSKQKSLHLQEHVRIAW